MWAMHSRRTGYWPRKQYNRGWDYPLHLGVTEVCSIASSLLTQTQTSHFSGLRRHKQTHNGHKRVHAAQNLAWTLLLMP